MDVRNINQVFVAKDVARTSTGGTEIIDGLTVPTTSVQSHAKLVDAGTAATSYYANGELLIADESGRTLKTSTSDIAQVPEIVIKQRSFDGTSHFASKPINGANITSYTLIPYAAAVEHVSVVHTIDATLTDHSYMIKIRRIGSDNNMIKEPTVKTAYFKSAAGGSTAAQIATGLAAYINTNFNTDLLLPVSAVVANVDELVITALPLTYETGKFGYAKLNFVVELVNFDATVEYNDFADLTVTDTYTQATKGSGTYEQIADLEQAAKLYTGANKDVMNGTYRRSIVPLDVQSTETYDKVLINWTRLGGDFSANVRQEGSVTLCLPVTNNGTNQVGVATAGIMAVLDAYIVTAYGVGTAQIGNIS